MVTPENNLFTNSSHKQPDRLPRDDFLGFTIENGPMPFPITNNRLTQQQGYLYETRDKGAWCIIPPKHKLPWSFDEYVIENTRSQLRGRQRFRSIPDQEELHRQNLYFVRVNWERLLPLFMNESPQNKVRHAPGFIEVTFGDRAINFDSDTSGRKKGYWNCGKPDFIGFIPNPTNKNSVSRAVILEFSTTTSKKYGQVARHTVGLEDILKQVNETGLPIDHYVCTYMNKDNINFLTINDPMPKVVEEVRNFPVERTVFSRKNK